MLLMLAVLASAPDAGAQEVAPGPIELAVLLKRMAQALPPANLPCGFTERTTAEEFDKNGQATARELHTFRIERKRDGAVKRDRVSVDKQLGELNARIRPKPDSELSNEEKERRRRGFRTPFRAEDQAAYKFEWAKPPAGGQATIAFSPIEKNPERGTGVATVDVESGRILSITSKPSKFPPFLHELDIQTQFGDTACGWQPTRLYVKGSGGFLFFQTRFRSSTTLDDYTPS